jgi:hypothetical protein
MARDAQGVLDMADAFVDACVLDPSAVAYLPGRTTPLVYSAVYRLFLVALIHGTESQSKERVMPLLLTVADAQDPDDGLFKESVAAECNDDNDDSWGWRHLSAQAVNALTLFGERARHPLTFVHELCSGDRVETWLDGLDWTVDAAATSNRVMNYGVALQYERDFMANSMAGSALARMFAWLDAHHNPNTGTWGSHPSTKKGLSMAVQTAYHMWVMYFYDSRPVPSLNAAIDSCLATQTNRGGFGYQRNTSACEDIDSIQPLAWFSRQTDYRHADVLAALERAWTWTLANQMDDGGFVFRIGEPFVYGNCPLFRSESNQGAMFPTWFRLLALAYVRQALGNSHTSRDVVLHLSRSPGYQSWG